MLEEKSSNQGIVKKRVKRWWCVLGKCRKALRGKRCCKESHKKVTGGKDKRVAEMGKGKKIRGGGAFLEIVEMT